jgi:adenosylcobinamide-GDP ribazoletransferase
MAVVATSVRYAREDGLASAFLGGSLPSTRVAVMVVGTPLSFVSIAIADGPVRAAVVIIGMAVVAALVTLAAWRRVHGFTGDVLGALCVTTETVALLLLAARW